MRKNNGKGRGVFQDGRGSLSQDERGLRCPVGFGIIRAAELGVHVCEALLAGGPVPGLGHWLWHSSPKGQCGALAPSPLIHPLPGDAGETPD